MTHGTSPGDPVGAEALVALLDPADEVGPVDAEVLHAPGEVAPAPEAVLQGRRTAHVELSAETEESHQVPKGKQEKRRTPL